MRYVLVHWSAGSLKTSILTEEYVLDKSMLDDPDKEGMVAYVQQPGDKLPKHQVTAHLGRVKYISECRDIIEEHQRLFLSVKSSPNPSHRLFVPKTRKRQRSECDDLCDTTSHNGSKEYGGRQDRSIIQMLENKIQNLENELTNLRRTNLMLQNNLPDLLRDALQSSTVIDLLKTCSKCSCNSDANDLKLREATLCSVEQPNPTREMSSEELNSWSESPDLPKDENQETKFWISSRNVSLSDLLDSENMERVSRSLTYKKMTTALLLSLFEKSVLAMSSVTGKSKAGRPALDSEIVNLIIDHVQQCFPHTRYQDIKATMAQKCKDLRKCAEKRDVRPKVED